MRYVLFYCSLLLSSNIKSEDFQVSVNSASETGLPTSTFYAHFLQPIKFTHHGLRCYITHSL